MLLSDELDIAINIKLNILENLKKEIEKKKELNLKIEEEKEYKSNEINTLDIEIRKKKEFKSDLEDLNKEIERKRAILDNLFNQEFKLKNCDIMHLINSIKDISDNISHFKSNSIFFNKNMIDSIEKVLMPLWVIVFILMLSLIITISLRVSI